MITITLVLPLFLDMEKNGAAPENTEEGADESLVIDEEKNNSDGKITLNFDIQFFVTTVLHGKKYHDITFEYSDDEKEFEPTVDMMMNEFDDERTIEEEEELGQEDEQEEISALEKEQDMPIEELMRLYGYNKPAEAAAEPQQEKPQQTAADQLEQPDSDDNDEPRHFKFSSNFAIFCLEYEKSKEEM